MSHPRTTLSHRRELRDEHVFEWQESDGTVCQFGFTSRRVLWHLAIGHLMRACVWGQA